MRKNEFFGIYNEHKALSLIRNVLKEAIGLSDRHKREAEALLDGQSPNLNQKHLFDVHEGMMLAARHTNGLVEKYWASLLDQDDTSR